MRTLLQIAWLGSGLVLAAWFWRKQRKFEWTDLLIIFWGPIAWTSVITAGLFMRRKGYTGTPWQKLACESLILATWVVWAVVFILIAKARGTL